MADRVTTERAKAFIACCEAWNAAQYLPCRLARDLLDARAEVAALQERVRLIVPASEIASAYGARDDESPDEWAGRIVRERDEALGRAAELRRDVRALADELEALEDEAFLAEFADE